MGVPASSLFSAAEPRSRWLLRSGDAQAVGNVAWAAATLGRDAPLLAAAVEEHARAFVGGGDWKAVAAAAWAFGRMGRRAPGFFEEIDGAAPELVGRGGPRAASSVLLAAAALRAPMGGLRAALEEGRGSFCREATAQAVCNAAYALAVGGGGGGRLGGALWEEAVGRRWGELGGGERNQMRVVAAHGGRLGELPEEEWGRSDRENSDFEESVGKVLGEMGLGFEREVGLLEGGGDLLAADFLLGAGGGGREEGGIVVECDGPSHFLRGEHGQRDGPENGPTVAKRRLLESKGYEVVNVPWWVNKGRGPIRAFLEERLGQRLR
ncbi:hypothetical protein TeGR_g3773 [Tetraparma gracilis]|uniref:RAP domain-containing protein n=1 Tax=Tetraparma gracilis TaxID=2962635 RepID=A0ABQ6MVU6_9STRA|nr:hypothetical protein TeGR_g3773 [Tetraparma gracilis]